MDDILQYTFMQHALIGSLLASIACGLVGTYIVTRRLVFISGGLTHASFGGIGLGLYTGMPPILAAAVFAVLSAFGVEWLSKRKEMREDSAIAVSVAGTLAVFFTLFLHPIVYVAFDREFARSQGIRVQLLEYALMMLIALTIVACLRMVGIVLVISLLTIPQMTANLFAQRFTGIIWLSIGIGYLSCLGGLYLSFRENIPSGASIIFFSIVIYAVCKAGKSLWTYRKRKANTIQSNTL